MSDTLLPLLLALTLLAGCGSHRAATTCRIGHLDPVVGPLWSEATGQHTLEIDLTNRSGRSCVVDGYPTIHLYGHHGQELAFRYSHKGDQMITPEPPRAIRLAPGGRAWFAFNKYRCDEQASDFSASIRIALPDSRDSVRVAIPRGARVIEYCAAPQSRTIAVSPVRTGLPGHAR